MKGIYLFLSSAKIQNYRSLKDIEIPLSSFVCIVGENNCGKSSTLLALSLFISGSKISKNDFYDHSKPITIEVEISEIDDNDLERIAESHRDRIKELLIDNKLKLIRRYETDLSNKLLVKKLLPIDNRFHEDKINEILKGQKRGAIEETMRLHLPEYEDNFVGVVTQSKAKETVEQIIGTFSPEKLEEKEVTLPTGIPNSIKLLLPEPILIPAVKDINDDVKTKESATFGRLMGVLLGLIEDTEAFEDILDSFDKFRGFLNRVETEEGIKDDRIEEVKYIEDVFQSYIQENFPKVKLELLIPPPELKKIFSGAEILIDDGVKSRVDYKGDGLKRAVTFALLRTFVQVNRNKKVSEENHGDKSPYLFLFEEPELYLHPAAQKILFEALCGIAENHQVIVTTHSPLFFSSEYTGTFVKMKKVVEEPTPYAHIKSINLLNNLEKKELFRLICFENNNAAFFSDKLVLVEGDSDLIFFKHISKILNEEWDFDLKNIPIIRIQGKGNVNRYKEFFEAFGIEVHVILDLDILIKDFNKLKVEESIEVIHNKLIDELDRIADDDGVDGSVSSDQVRDLVRSYSWLEKYERLKVLSKKGAFLTADEQYEIDLLFSKESENKRKNILQNNRYEVPVKNELLDRLREQNIYVLSKGAVESYYPEGTGGRDKPSKALKACELLQDKKKILEVCPIIDEDVGKTEFEVIFENIFG